MLYSQQVEVPALLHAHLPWLEQDISLYYEIENELAFCVSRSVRAFQH